MGFSETTDGALALRPVAGGGGAAGSAVFVQQCDQRFQPAPAVDASPCPARLGGNTDARCGDTVP